VDSSLQAFCAIIICVEHSFWHLSPSVSFSDAFKMAFMSYQDHGMVKKMATALSVIHQKDGSISKKTLEEVILMHCLSPPKYDIPQSGPLTEE